MPSSGSRPNPGLAGIVLCGGASRRMGRDKALLRLEGESQPLVLLVASRLATVADPVILAPGSPGRLGVTGHPEVADAVPGCGPLGGLVAGLQASPHELAAVVAVDMPAISPAVLRLLRGLWDGEDAVVPLVGARAEPLHAVYSRGALPQLLAALREGILALHQVLKHLSVRWVDSDEWSGAEPRGSFAANLNRPEDLSARPPEAGA